MTDTLLLGIIIGYFIIAFFIAKYVNKYLKQLYWSVRLIILSFTYALLFGIGAIGGGSAEPGFALPAPIIFAGLDSYPDKVIDNAIIPFFFWWTVLLFGMLVIKIFKAIRLRIEN